MVVIFNQKYSSAFLLIDFQNWNSPHDDKISSSLANLIEEIYVQDESRKTWEDRSILLDRNYDRLKFQIEKFYKNNPS